MLGMVVTMMTWDYGQRDGRQELLFAITNMVWREVGCRLLVLHQFQSIRRC